MERYIVHALILESGETLRMTGKPNKRKETPSPNNTASPIAKNRKNGSWVEVGSTPMSAGGKRTGPRKKAGTATAAVMAATLAEVFIFIDAPLLSVYLLCGALRTTT